MPFCCVVRQAGVGPGLVTDWLLVCLSAIWPDLRDLIRVQRPELLAETGCGPLIAAILIGQTARAERFKSDAHFARLPGVAPVPVSSGRSDRHRLDRGGNRQLNRALHIIAITRGRLDPATRAYLQRKEAEGKSRMEAMRCLSATSLAGTIGCSAKDRDQQASCASPSPAVALHGEHNAASPPAQS